MHHLITTRTQKSHHSLFSLIGLGKISNVGIGCASVVAVFLTWFLLRIKFMLPSHINQMEQSDDSEKHKIDAWMMRCCYIVFINLQWDHSLFLIKCNIVALHPSHCWNQCLFSFSLLHPSSHEWTRLGSEATMVEVFHLFSFRQIYYVMKFRLVFKNTLCDMLLSLAAAAQHFAISHDREKLIALSLNNGGTLTLHRHCYLSPGYAWLFHASSSYPTSL